MDLNFHQTFLHSEEISISSRKYFSSLCDAEDEESEMQDRIKPEEKQEKLSQERREGQRGKYQTTMRNKSIGYRRSGLEREKDLTKCCSSRELYFFDQDII